MVVRRALVYDSDTVHFYLDGVRSTDESDHGDLVARATDVVIGQAGEGSDHEYFTGLIDEVKIFGARLNQSPCWSTMPLLVSLGQIGFSIESKFFLNNNCWAVTGRALAHEEVLEIFRSSIHGGGHCENSADLAHCDLATGDGNFDYCGTSL